MGMITALLSDSDDNLAEVLEAFGFDVTSFIDATVLMHANQEFAFIMVRAGSRGSRLPFIPVIRYRWKNAKIAVISGGHELEGLAMTSGADVFIKDSGRVIENLQAAFRKLKIPS